MTSYSQEKPYIPYDFALGPEAIRDNGPIVPLRRRLVGKVASAFSGGADRAKEKFSAAANWWSSKVQELSERRQTEKSSRQDYGSIDDIRDLFEKPESPAAPENRQAWAPETYLAPTQEAPGLYRSEFARMEDPLSVEEIIGRAAVHARAEVDGAKVAELEETYNAPAIADGDRNTPPRHARPDAEYTPRHSADNNGHTPMHAKV